MASRLAVRILDRQRFSGIPDTVAREHASDGLGVALTRFAGGSIREGATPKQYALHGA
jgi:hypothetical protein